MQRVGVSELGYGMFERDVDPAGEEISTVGNTSQYSNKDMNVENELLLERLAGW